jgi:hypothetical protein
MLVQMFLETTKTKRIKTVIPLENKDKNNKTISNQTLLFETFGLSSQVRIPTVEMEFK